MYSQTVLDHFHHPRNVGEIENASAVVEVTNPVCGDTMKLWAVLEEGKARAVRFKVAGCVPAVACGSYLTELMRGKGVAELAGITAEQIEAALGGLPPASHHASLLAVEALKRLLEKMM